MRKIRLNRPFVFLSSLFVLSMLVPSVPLDAQAISTGAPLTASANALSIEAPPWWIGYTLILSDVSTPAAMRATVQRITDAGGRVGVMTEPDVVFGWLPAKNIQALISAGAKAVYQTAIAPKDMGGLHPNTQAAMKLYNAVSSGEFFARATAPPGLEKRSCMTSPGTPIEGATTYWLNDGLRGYVNVAAIFVESIHDPNVPGSDTDVYTWTESAFWDVFDATWAGLSRLSNIAYYAGETLYFSLGAGYPWANDAQKQPYEPILHEWYQYDMWLGTVMDQLGYSGGAKVGVENYNEWRRNASGADHATTFAFVMNSSNHPTFDGGGTSITPWAGGPFVEMPYLYGIGASAEQAHELGHIFWACDEYEGGCSSCDPCNTSGPRPLVGNCNCHACHANQVACLMWDASSSSVCGWTAQRFDWFNLLPSCPW